MRAAVVLFNRDLRVHDHPALTAASEQAEAVMPLFVLDEAILSGSFMAPNRAHFLAESLRDLDDGLRRAGSKLVIRRGDPVDEALRVASEAGAEAVFASADVSGHAQARERRLADACAGERIELSLHPGVTAIPAGTLTPTSGDHYRVFTPYWRAWSDAHHRAPVGPPRRLSPPDGLRQGTLPTGRDLATGDPSPGRAPGGEGAGRERLDRWLDHEVAGYDDGHDALAADATSRLSPYLHFGCLSPAEIVTRSDQRRSGVSPFVRQVCWRDFHHQVLAARPGAATWDYRSRNDAWLDDDEAFEAWSEGRTGYPIVDAGMRQLAQEGWMHNRTRLVTGNFLCKDLYLDWRRGAQHFFELLVDGDMANNTMNWQWVAGTGTDTRPNRTLNPLRQAERYDPNGDYVRRHVPELADVEGRAVHRPWDLDPERRRRLDYPEPLVDHADAVTRFRHARGK